MVGNATIAITKTYRIQLWFSWALTVAAMGAMSTLQADSSLTKAIGFPVLLGVGSGLWYGATYFPVLAPLPVSQIAPALSFFAFGRQFAGVRITCLIILPRSDKTPVGLGRHDRHRRPPNPTHTTSPGRLRLQHPGRRQHRARILTHPGHPDTRRALPEPGPGRVREEHRSDLAGHDRRRRHRSARVAVHEGPAAAYADGQAVGAGRQGQERGEGCEGENGGGCGDPEACGARRGVGVSLPVVVMILMTVLLRALLYVSYFIV